MSDEKKRKIARIIVVVVAATMICTSVMWALQAMA